MKTADQHEQDLRDAVVAAFDEYSKAIRRREITDNEIAALFRAMEPIELMIEKNS